MICKRVILIGLDGAGTAICDVPTPNINRVFSRGAYTYNAVAALPTISAECWAAMLLGVLPAVHMLTNEHIEVHPYPVDSPYPTIFRMIRNAYPSCKLASFCSWQAIQIGIIEKNLDCYSVSAPDGELPGAVASYLAEHDPKLLFVQFDDCDYAGHDHGFFSQGHFDTVQLTDKYIGIILDSIEANGLWDDSLIMIVTDHGGGGEDSKEHGSAHPKDRTVFWGACGPGIRKGVILDAPVHIVDTAAICLKALGLAPHKNMAARIPSGMFIDP